MLNITSWMTKVSERLLLLKYINAIETFSCPSNGSTDISIANSEQALIVGAGASNSKIVAVASATSSGAVSSLKVAGATSMTLTNGTNIITINNGYGYAMHILVIKF